MPFDGASSNTLDSPPAENPLDGVDFALSPSTLPELDDAGSEHKADKHRHRAGTSEIGSRTGPPKIVDRPVLLSKFVQLKKLKLPSTFDFVTTQPLPESRAKFRTSWLQDTTCLSRTCQGLLKHGSTQCAACSARSNSSGGCRFKRLRKFDTSVTARQTQYTLTSDKTTSESARRKYKPFLSANGQIEDAHFLLRCIKEPFMNILVKERQHDTRPGIIRRHRDTETRNVCDGCATTIFSGHWICYVCARELCLNCYDEWDDSQAATGRFLHLNRCINRARQARQMHTKTQMLPSTRFGENELDILHHDLLLAAEFRENDPPVIPRPISIFKHSEGLPYAKADFQNLPFHEFRQHWATGQPLLLSGFQDRFELSWTPEYFISNFGHERTELVDVISKAVRPSTVGDFFEGLKTENAGAMRHLKLNDWPVVDDFATAMPELFEDFERALPYPIYTRRQGFLNLATWFPPEFLPPDLGPKLYCAGASSDAAGANGTTVLHMDMTDAINIMTWAGAKPEDRLGCAVWDVFTPSDLEPIRFYLLEKWGRVNPKMIMDDPIRRAQFYLNKTDLENLAERGVFSKRIYQNPGDAVFMPAGCAHQVCNLTPCIKVACDFVCPENILCCSKITEADRKLAGHAKREDVLQLQNVIYFAYLGVSEWLRDPVPGEKLTTIDTKASASSRKRPETSKYAIASQEENAEPRTASRRDQRKRKASNFLEYNSDDLLEASIDHEAPEVEFHHKQQVKRKQQETTEHHENPMFNSPLKASVLSFVQPGKRLRRRRNLSVDESDQSARSECDIAKRESRHAKPSHIVKLRLRQSTIPKQEQLTSAESAYASFIEQFGYDKLAELFYADKSYLTRDMQDSNDDMEIKSIMQCAASSPKTKATLVQQSAVQESDTKNTMSEQTSIDHTPKDVDHSNIEGIDQATTNGDLEVLSELTGVNQSNLRDTATMDQSTTTGSEELSKKSTFNDENGNFTNDDSQNTINGSLQTAPSNVTSS